MKTNDRIGNVPLLCGGCGHPFKDHRTSEIDACRALEAQKAKATGVHVPIDREASFKEGAAEARAKRPKRESNPDRWARLVAEAKAALEQAKEALEPLNDMRQEYADRFDNMNEGLQASAFGQKCEAMQNLDLDSAVENLDSAISSCEEADGMEVPLGFGRD